MDKLNVSLINCFGIESLDHEFDFKENGKVVSIYARNGSMKTSFAKTFQLISEGKQKDIKDVLYDKKGTAKILVDGQPIQSNQVFAIKSFESAYESDITPLLIRGEIKEKLGEILKARSDLFKALEGSSGLKVKKTSGGKEVYELEPKLAEDFSYEKDSFLLSLDSISSSKPELECADIQYSDIFSPSVIKKIKDKKFQDGIKNYIKVSDEIYRSFGYLEKGHLTLPKLKDLKKELEKSGFFVKDNFLSLTGEGKVSDVQTLGATIATIENKVKETAEYKAIEDLLGDVGGRALKDIIETHPEIIEFLAESKLPALKKSLWRSYLQKHHELFDGLKEKFQVLSSLVDSVQIEETIWSQSLDIFKQRFFVPFEMSISNLKACVIGECVPQIEFTFEKGSDKKVLNRSGLEDIDVLSQGEKRALYLLNIIFDLEKLKIAGNECVLVIDDIADSFDYKNKYAIIEYLYDLAHEGKFYLLILTHNFDFHRTVTSRLGIKRINLFIVEPQNSSIILNVEKYQKHPIETWKTNPDEKQVLALIPFVRNLIEYGIDQNICGLGDDYLFLTALLHIKANTHLITYASLAPLLKTYLGVQSRPPSVTLADQVLGRIYAVCDGIQPNETDLENKIVLAMGIRLKAEEFMIAQLSGHSQQIKQSKKPNALSVSCVDYLTEVENSSNQTRMLLNGYEQFGLKDKREILNEVMIMTPEHIHINSFMYEPIMDMDIQELLRLYYRTKTL